jgi:hypothetical protein
MDRFDRYKSSAYVGKTRYVTKAEALNCVQQQHKPPRKAKAEMSV